jgi:hypothetical protein
VKRSDVDETARALLVAAANYVTDPNARNKRRVSLALKAHSRTFKRHVRLNARIALGSRDAFELAGTDANRLARGDQ